MSGHVFIIKGDESLEELTEQRWDSQDVLRALIAKHPNPPAGDRQRDVE